MKKELTPENIQTINNAFTKFYGEELSQDINIFDQVEILTILFTRQEFHQNTHRQTLIQALSSSESNFPTPVDIDDAAKALARQYREYRTIQRVERKNQAYPSKTSFRKKIRKKSMRPPSGPGLNVRDFG